MNADIPGDIQIHFVDEFDAHASRERRGRGETVEAALIKQRLDLALARAEVPVKASRFCRMKVAA